MVGLTLDLSRRAALGGGVLLLAGSADLLAQESARAKKFREWVDQTLKTEKTSPMTNARMLGFARDVVQRKQLGIKKDGMQRLFAVVVPEQRDGIVLAMGFADSKTYNVHRTGVHLRRVGSGRNINGIVSRWSGAECEKDFEAQISFWATLAS